MAAAPDARAHPVAIGDRRVLFLGDSFVAGVGDPIGLGWSFAWSYPDLHMAEGAIDPYAADAAFAALLAQRDGGAQGTGVHRSPTSRR